MSEGSWQGGLCLGFISSLYFMAEAQLFVTCEYSCTEMAFNFLLPLLEGFCVCMSSDKLEMLVLCLNLQFTAEGNLQCLQCESKRFAFAGQRCPSTSLSWFPEGGVMD